MKLRVLAAACCSVLPAISAVAQSPAPAADPISGTWAGDMGPSPSSRNTVKMELKFDGKSVVTGKATGPSEQAEIKTGNFDPVTGVLKLEAELKDGSTTKIVVFDGTVVRGIAMGRVLLNNQTGSFAMTKEGTPSAGKSSASNADALATARKSFGEASAWVTKAAGLVPADKYTYRPVPTVRTYGQLVAHVADAYNWYCQRALGKDAKWSDAIEKGKTDKATVTAALSQALAVCNTAYGGAGQIDALIENVGHTNLHYGNIVTYMRMLGMVPPSS